MFWKVSSWHRSTVLCSNFVKFCRWEIREIVLFIWPKIFLPVSQTVATAPIGMMDTSPMGHFAYWTVRLLFGHLAYWTLRLLAISPTRHFAYWTVRLLDSSPTAWTVRSQILHIWFYFTLVVLLVKWRAICETVACHYTHRSSDRKCTFLWHGHLVLLRRFSETGVVV